MAAAIAAISISAQAQLLVTPGERGTLKWNYITSPDYKIIYPEGMDSLAVRYGTLLQYYRPEVGRTAGYIPNQMWRQPMPVVLHPYTAISNGMVVEGPHRMELYTMPDTYGALPPVPWEQLLSIHENRHVAQIQFSYNGFWEWMYYPFGEFPSLFVGSLYPNAALLEGDAVVAETALTNSGRGRTADFLAYYRMAWDNGDIRNWYKWRYGSLNRYTPDYYALGYVTVGGARARYDAPMFMSDYLHRLTKPWGVNAVHNTVMKYSRKRFKVSWLEIAKMFNDDWRQDDSLRGPFQDLDVLTTKNSRRFTTYRGAVAVNNNHRIFAVRAALDMDPQLVEISSRGIRYLRPFGAESRLTYSEHTNCIYWSSSVANPRWEMEQDSRIQMMDLHTYTVKDFTLKGRYFNPVVSPDGKSIAAVEYPRDGSCKAVIFDIDTREKIKEINAPEGVRFTEPAFWGDGLVLASIQEGGSAVYFTDFASVRTVLGPYPYVIKNLTGRKDGIYLSSDRNGTNEIYVLNPDTGALVQKTNTRYGASSPFFLGNEMYFSALLPEGKLLAKADGDYSVQVNPADIHSYPIADILSLQEDTLRLASTAPLLDETPAEPSRPRPYSRAGNLLYIHSWLPFYFNYDTYSATYSQYNFESASLGLTAFFQNLTGTANGIIGVSAHQDPSSSDRKIATGLHLRMNYSGLYPVFDMALDVGDRPSAILQHMYDVERDSLFLDRTFEEDSRIKRLPFYIGGKLGVGVPLSFSRGGWNTAIKPYLSISSSSDLLRFPMMRVVYDPQTESYVSSGESSRYGIASSLVTEARLNFARTLSQSPSQAIPRLGYGFDVDAMASLYSEVLYANFYAYTPGFFRTNGLKLSHQMQFSHMDQTTALTYWPTGAYDLSPRGFEDYPTGALMNRLCPKQEKLSLDYVIQAFSIDSPITQYVYLRNMEFIPFVDFTRMRFFNNDALPHGDQYLYSAGMDISLRFERFFFRNGDTHLGLRLSYNGGSAFNWFQSQQGGTEHFHVGIVSSFDL